MSQPQVVTFGCRINTYESEIIRNLTRSSGIDDILVINTCAVTAEAERQARQAIRRARRSNPDLKIIVTGCSAQINSDQYSSMDEVDIVLGNEEKLKTKTWETIQNSGSLTQANDIMAATEITPLLIDGYKERARAFVQVQQGCDHRCTFCIIPFGRGPSRSKPVGEVVREVRSLVENGYKEVILTGVDLTDYGKGLPGQPTLGNLSQRLLIQVPELTRLRLSSLDPAEIDTNLFKLMEKEERLLPHFHLSIQAGDDIVLKRMKRRHSRSDIINTFNHIRQIRPNATFGADLIAGFPTETDEMFQNTLRIIDECDLTHLHVFPYSERSGTPASKMPSVPKHLRRKRASLLRKAGNERMRCLLEGSLGNIARVLIEKDGKGHCERNLPVNINDQVQQGSLITCSIKRLNGAYLEAEGI